LGIHGGNIHWISVPSGTGTPLVIEKEDVPKIPPKTPQTAFTAHRSVTTGKNERGME
jgi:hypothetical protein